MRSGTGRRTGGEFEQEVQKNRAKLEQYEALCKELGEPPAAVALAWLLRLPEISSVITGASRVSQVHENLKAAELKTKLTPEILARIETILGNDPKVA